MFIEQKHWETGAAHSRYSFPQRKLCIWPAQLTAGSFHCSCLHETICPSKNFSNSARAPFVARNAVVDNNSEAVDSYVPLHLSIAISCLQGRKISPEPAMPKWISQNWTLSHCFLNTASWLPHAPGGSVAIFRWSGKWLGRVLRW